MRYYSATDFNEALKLVLSDKKVLDELFLDKIGYSSVQLGYDESRCPICVRMKGIYEKGIVFNIFTIKADNYDMPWEETIVINDNEGPKIISSSYNLKKRNEEVLNEEINKLGIRVDKEKESNKKPNFIREKINDLKNQKYKVIASKYFNQMQECLEKNQNKIVK